MMWGGYGGGGGPSWMMAANGVFWLILLGIAAAVIYRLVRPTGQMRSGANSSGLSILEERYARGEIQRDEYLQKKQDLLGHGAS